MCTQYTYHTPFKLAISLVCLVPYFREIAHQPRLLIGDAAIFKKIKTKMRDIFDNTILCKKCNTKMQKAQVAKNRFLFRALVCPKCNEKIIHPTDEAEYDKFINLKNKEFRVKMRLVGNSYAVSIPKEIVSFMREQEKMMDDMVKLCFEDFGRLSLRFEQTNKLNRKVLI